MDPVEKFELDLAVALATCPKRLLKAASASHGGDEARREIARHCAARMRPWTGGAPGEPPRTH